MSSLYQLTSISICFCSISILEPVIPRPFILCSTTSIDPGPVSSFEAMSPFPFVNPVSFGLHSQTMTLPLRPVALEGVPAGPGVDSHHFETVVPGAGELSLAFGPRADAMAVSFAPLPASAISSTVVELEPTSAHDAARRGDATLGLETKAKSCYLAKKKTSVSLTSPSPDIKPDLISPRRAECGAFLSWSWFGDL